MRALLILILLAPAALAYGQKKINIGGDVVHLRDSLNGKIILLDSIEKRGKNENTFWIQYNRRPGVDPWLKGYRGDDKFTDNHFIEFFSEHTILISGAVTTYDPCLCAKQKTMDSPDMYLINFKISKKEWEKLIKFYPGIQDSKRL
jgi:hypothetical protein